MKEQDLMREGFLAAIGTILCLIMAAVMMITMTACNRAAKVSEEPIFSQVSVVSSCEQDQGLFEESANSIVINFTAVE